ncbi:hypothetical protein K1719_014101 [Acacia pycnantha]|nr:hypothetical protein K1719_014101 [Acacia pycnantha]
MALQWIRPVEAVACRERYAAPQPVYSPAPLSGVDGIPWVAKEIRHSPPSFCLPVYRSTENSSLESEA